MIYVDLPSDIYMYDEFCNLKPRKEWVALKDNSLANGGIDEKRKAYADQAKCAIGKLQEYMDIVTESYKNAKTDIIIQGVSTIRELAGMTRRQIRKLCQRPVGQSGYSQRETSQVSD